MTVDDSDQDWADLTESIEISIIMIDYWSSYWSFNDQVIDRFMIYFLLISELSPVLMNQVDESWWRKCEKRTSTTSQIVDRSWIDDVIKCDVFMKVFWSFSDRLFNRFW